MTMTNENEQRQWPGLSWRILVRDWKAPRQNIHDLSSDGTSWFDELVVGDWFHLEWMHGRTWWMRVGDASIYVTIPKEKQPVLQIQRGVYHACPSPEEDAQALAEVDPHDDAYGPDDLKGEYYKCLPSAEVQGAMVAVNPRDPSRIVRMVFGRRMATALLSFLVDGSNENLYVWGPTHGSYEQIAAECGIDYRRCLRGKAKLACRAWSLTFEDNDESSIVDADARAKCKAVVEHFFNGKSIDGGSVSTQGSES
jgi:hypothetical protein